MTKILVVDDNLANLELACDLLEMEGYEVRSAEGGEASVVIAREYQPDLILMDMRMPGISGLEALRELRKSHITHNIPVVILTASVMKGEKERMLAEGFDGFMQKPIDISSFSNEVRSYLKK